MIRESGKEKMKEHIKDLLIHGNEELGTISCMINGRACLGKHGTISCNLNRRARKGRAYGDDQSPEAQPHNKVGIWP